MWSKRPRRRGSSTSPASSGSIATASVSSDFRLQAVQTFENLKNALAAVGGRFQDVVKLNNYLTDLKYLPTFRQVRDSYLADAEPPGQHDHRDFGPGARGRAARDRGGGGTAGGGTREAGAPSARARPRDYQSFAAETKVSSAKIGSRIRRRPDHVAEEARHLDAALVGDRIDHEVRRVADIGQRAHEDRAHRDRRERRRERPISACASPPASSKNTR